MFVIEIYSFAVYLLRLTNFSGRWKHNWWRHNFCLCRHVDSLHDDLQWTVRSVQIETFKETIRAKRAQFGNENTSSSNISEAGCTVSTLAKRVLSFLQYNGKWIRNLSFHSICVKMAPKKCTIELKGKMWNILNSIDHILTIYDQQFC